MLFNLVSSYPIEHCNSYINSFPFQLVNFTVVVANSKAFAPLATTHFTLLSCRLYKKVPFRDWTSVDYGLWNVWHIDVDFYCLPCFSK